MPKSIVAVESEREGERVNAHADKINIFNFPSRIKTAFTLAEVLVTLTIIGVVSAMTIPSMKANIDKQTTIQRFKKTYSILFNAYKMSVMDNGHPTQWEGFQKNPLTQGETNESKVLANYFLPYLKVSKDCGTERGECFPKKLYNLNKKQTSYMDERVVYNVVLQDGAALSFAQNTNGSAEYWTILTDIDGANKGQNVMGKDIFMFVIDKDGEFGPYNYFNRDRKGLLAAYDDSCNKNAGVTAGMACSTVIILDGFQIKDDYPW